MPIRVTCPKCQKQYNLVDRLAGRQVACKACNFVMDVPGPASPTPAVTASVSPVPAARKPAASSSARPSSSIQTPRTQAAPFRPPAQSAPVPPPVQRPQVRAAAEPPPPPTLDFDDAPPTAMPP